ncbi:MAG: FliH/SctL family protein [Steroidobacteraceae bacterium]|jgi:flagellar assembly protein FliH|nr:FliH/SctL family protein [Steroidobacteraceae bacterium]
MSEATTRRGAAAAPWVLPAVRGPVVGRPGAGQSPAALEAEYRQAWRNGFEEGRREGLAAGATQLEARERELASRIAEVEAVLRALARPLERLDDAAAAELARLAVVTGTQLARRELRQDPAQIIAVIRECVNALPASARHVRVHLHPADAAVIRERLAQPAAERAWTLVEDPVLGRGGCRVTSDASQVDARFDSRVAAVMAAVLGDERDGVREDDVAPPAAAEEAR